MKYMMKKGQVGTDKTSKEQIPLETNASFTQSSLKLAPVVLSNCLPKSCLEIQDDNCKCVLCTATLFCVILCCSFHNELNYKFSHATQQFKFMLPCIFYAYVFILFLSSPYVSQCVELVVTLSLLVFSLSFQGEPSRQGGFQGEHVTCYGTCMLGGACQETRESIIL